VGAIKKYRVCKSESEGARGVSNDHDSPDGKALIMMADSLREAIKQAKLAYQFAPNSYTHAALDRLLAAAHVFDEHVERLAFRVSAEWLRKFPKIIEDSDAE
jgi:hypothetical protein